MPLPRTTHCTLNCRVHRGACDHTSRCYGVYISAAYCFSSAVTDFRIDMSPDIACEEEAQKIERSEDGQNTYGVTADTASAAVVWSCVCRRGTHVANLLLVCDFPFQLQQLRCGVERVYCLFNFNQVRRRCRKSATGAPARASAASVSGDDTDACGGCHGHVVVDLSSNVRRCVWAFLRRLCRDRSSVIHVPATKRCAIGVVSRQ